MKKLFISQPMRDKTDDEIKAERKKLIEITKKRIEEDIEVIDSFFEGDPHDATPLWYLGKSIELLSEADVAIFALGWQKYRGCRIEHWCCEYYSIPTIEVTEGD